MKFITCVLINIIFNTILYISSYRAYGKAGNGNEMETGNGNWKLKTEMETQPFRCCSHSNLVGFGPRHPSAFPGSSFRHRRPQLQCNVLTWVMFMFSAAFYLWCSILSKQLILYKYALYVSCYLNQNTTPCQYFCIALAFCIGGAMCWEWGSCTQGLGMKPYFMQSKLEVGLGMRLKEQECSPCSKTKQVITVVVRLQLVLCPYPLTCGLQHIACHMSDTLNKESRSTVQE